MISVATGEDRRSAQMADTRTEGLNFQLSWCGRPWSAAPTCGRRENYDNATRLDSVSSRLTLDNGLVTLNRLQGQSDVMAMTGEGQLDLQRRTAMYALLACACSAAGRGRASIDRHETDRYPAAPSTASGSR